MLAAVLALGAACSSSGGKDPTATLPPVPTAFPQPTLDADNVSVPLKGFTAKIPADFHLRSNFATDAGARFPTDAFFGPKAENGIQASIALTCYAPEAGKTLEDYRTQWLQFVTAFSSTNIQNADTTVSGLPALVFTYNQVLHGADNGSDTGAQGLRRAEAGLYRPSGRLPLGDRRANAARATRYVQSDDRIIHRGAEILHAAKLRHTGSPL